MGSASGGFVLRGRAGLWRGVGFCGAGAGAWNIGGFVLRVSGLGRGEMLTRAGIGSGERGRVGSSREGGAPLGGFVLHGPVMARVGSVWRALAGFGARERVVARARVVWLSRRIGCPSLLLTVVRVWDHVGASRGRNVGF